MAGPSCRLLARRHKAQLTRFLTRSNKGRLRTSCISVSLFPLFQIFLRKARDWTIGNVRVTGSCIYCPPVALSLVHLFSLILILMLLSHLPFSHRLRPCLDFCDSQFPTTSKTRQFRLLFWVVPRGSEGFGIWCRAHFLM
jgi:hypothetical protein